MPNQLSADQVIVGDVKVLTGGQVQKVLVAAVTRAMTTATAIGTLPAGAQITALEYQGAAVSNAGTTATIQVGVSGGNGHDYLPATDVKGATGAGQYQPTSATLPTSPLAAATTVTAQYAESGAASSAGGPWLVAISFVTATS